MNTCLSAIKGQARPMALLEEYSRQEDFYGTFLFSGPEGIGKKMAAFFLAKALNCERGSFPPCLSCPACLKIEKNQHPDVYLIDSNTPIDVEFEGAGDPGGESESIRIGHIRQLQKNANLRPYEGKKKVFIIDNAHKLTGAASNAFLKVLEEPPSSSLIILVADKPQNLFKTIISRCKVVKFQCFRPKLLESLLINDYAVEKSYAHFLAYFCEGRLGYALRLKDEDMLVRKNRVIECLGLWQNKFGQGLNISSRQDMRSYLNILAAWFRDIYMAKLGLGPDSLINLDRIADLDRLKDRYSFSELSRIMDELSESLFYLERNINLKLLINNLGAKLWKG